MTDSRDLREDGLEPALEAWLSEGDGAAGTACPDANALAALATSRVLEAERESIEAHLQSCRACRTAVAAAVRTVPQAEQAPAFASRARGRRRFLYVPLAAAAIVLVLLGLQWLETDPPARSTDDALFARVADLERKHPKLFAGVRALTHDERLRPSDVLVRGTAQLEAPVGTVLAERPEFVWASTSQATLTVSTDEGAVLVRAAGIKSPWPWPAERPPLPRGRTYLVELETAGVLGPETTQRTFAIASTALAGRYARQVAAIRAANHGPLHSLVLAHVALRQGLLLEARKHVDAFRAARPADRTGRETLFQVLTRMGHPDAGAVLEVR